MRISPDSSVFDSWPEASGSGVHSDEASAAIPDIDDLVSASTLSTLEHFSPNRESDVARPNPSPDAIVSYSELTRIAFLTTGTWGPGGDHQKTILASEVGMKRHLPMARSNPHPRFGSGSFWQRMQTLLNLLEKFESDVAGRYGQRSGPPAKSQPWAKVAKSMREAVEFVVDQESRQKQLSILASNGLPFGKKWGILAKGNAKLPYTAYSELPMSTCPGAGACSVRIDQYDGPAKERKKAGWCYSFKAFRYPEAFSRLFLNTLANYVDREAVIIANGDPGSNEDAPGVYAARVRAGIAGIRSRVWPDYVKNLALKMTEAKRKLGFRVFMRLFVDGDINHEDQILAWVEAARRIGPNGGDIKPGYGHFEIYGYSKCWSQFVNVDRFIGKFGGWPSNYTVNLSSGSVYATAKKYASIREKMENLPISRGYFEAVSLERWLPNLQAQANLLRQHAAAGSTAGVVPAPPLQSPTISGLDFKEERIRDFVLLQSVRTPRDVVALIPTLKLDEVAGMKLDEEQLFRFALEKYLDDLVWDDKFGIVIRREAAKDVAKETEYLKILQAESKKTLEKKLFAVGKRGSALPAELEKLHKKALALVLHEVLWSYNLGGSCPLLCGNCSDHPTDPALGVHRCASKSTLRHKTITIGLH